MSVLLFDGVQVDLGSGAVAGAEPLTPTERELLLHLVAHRGQPVSRRTLLTEVWGWSPDATTRTVDTAVGRLRAKIEVDPAAPRWVITVHGAGYVLRRPRIDLEPPPAELRGREAALVSIRRWLVDAPRSPWLTLTGPGGCGKSALLCALPSDSAVERFTGGVYGVCCGDAAVAWLTDPRGRGALLLVDLADAPPRALAERVHPLLDLDVVRVVCAARSPLHMRGEAALRVGPIDGRLPLSDALPGRAARHASLGANARSTLAALTPVERVALIEVVAGQPIADTLADRLFEAGLVDIDDAGPVPAAWTAALLEAADGP
ncbi:MAG: hypothetical protein ACI8PZ_005587 [Myxococcota bacterium]